MEYNIHPIFVHFPIALLFLYSVIKIAPLRSWFPKVSWKHIENTFLVLGVLGAFAALSTGEIAERLVRPDRQLVEMHSLFATTATALYGLLLAGEVLSFLTVSVIPQLKMPRFTSFCIFIQKILTHSVPVAYYHIVDPQKSVIAIENVYDAVNQISQTTVRNVVGQFMLDQLLSQTADINAQIKDVIDAHTEPWGAQVTAVEIKDIILPDNMQRAMAKEAEAERERRAKIVAAQGEFQAAQKLGEAADIIADHPVALQLRTLQTMSEIATEKNSTIIFPAQFMTTVQEAFKTLRADSEKK